MGRDSFREIIETIEPEDLIEIVFYSGYKEEETPREILIKGQKFWVDKVLGRRREIRGEQRVEVFVCQIEDVIIWLETTQAGYGKISRILNTSD